MRHALRWWTMLVLALAACERGGSIGGIRDSTFIATMADLRRIAADPALDSIERAAARAEALQGRGLTPEALERAARALAAEPERAREVLQAIEDRVRADTTARLAP